MTKMAGVTPKTGHITGRPNGIADRKGILELIMHFIADTDTDVNDFRINCS